jgi:hypothetical protein
MREAELRLSGRLRNRASGRFRVCTLIVKKDGNHEQACARKTERQIDRAARPRKAIVIANGIATVFMFVSWLAQNVYQSELESTKSNIEKDVQFSNSG